MALNQPAYFHMMAKPTSYHCNIKCEYCFYLEKKIFFKMKKKEAGHIVMPDGVPSLY